MNNSQHKERARKRDYYQRTKDRRRPHIQEYQRRWYLENREELLAKAKVRHDKHHVYLRNGTLAIIPNKPVNIGMCILCGNEKRTLVYHHWDDSHPEHGIWVCRPCHRTCEDVERGIVDTYLRVKQEVLQGKYL